MPSLDLTDEDKSALIELLRETVERSRHRLLSPRMRRLQAILDKLAAAGAATQANTGTEAAGRAQHGADEEAAAVTRDCVERVSELNATLAGPRDRVISGPRAGSRGRRRRHS